MKEKKFRIRTRIIFIFTVLLLFSFSMTMIIFNVAVNKYIQNNAIMQLKSVEIMFQALEQMQSSDIIPLQPNAAPINRNNFRIQADMFPVDERGNLLENMNITDEMTEIIRAVNTADIDFKDMTNQRIKTDTGMYYISTYYMAESPAGENIYSIAYADVTGLSYFASTINIFLIILVLVMFGVTVVAAIFLSNAITLPIKKLNSLALSMGHGDFTPNNFKFKDIEFENLNMTLNKTARQLNIYDREQKTFFQNVSHELRTPIMSIKCYAEGINFGVMDSTDASGTILQETDRLSEMVKDLLYISKIDNITSVYMKTKIDLLEIIRSCAEQQKVIAEARQICFSFDFKESCVYYDCVEELIKRAVNNIISNAIRYTASEIVLSCCKNQNNIVIQVTDNGKGIEAESMPRIFERFYKGSGGNHGIGLSLVKSVVEQHNGEITATNSEKGGAVFTIKLPYTARR